VHGSPKAIFCSELEEGTRAGGGQRKCYSYKVNLKRCDIAPPELEELALDRSDWRSHCKTWVKQFDMSRSWGRWKCETWNCNFSRPYYL